jgi:hypothetical protein
VDEHDMDFRRPTERRDPKQFEPPPWEQDAFAELERKRLQAEEERRRAEQEAAEDQARSEAESKPSEQPAPPEPEQAEELQPKPQLEERVVIEMLAGLAAEEPSPRQSYSAVAIVVGAGVAVLGAVMVVWAVAALVGAQRSGLVGTVAGTGLGLFGFFFFGMGLWLVYRALKQRGVL